MAKLKSKYPKGKHPNSLKNLKLFRFRIGQSGNSKGRPKGVKYISEALREQLGDKATVDELAKELIKRAKKSDSAINIVFDRTEGKVTLPIGGDPNMPIITEIVAHVTKDKNGSSSGS